MTLEERAQAKRAVRNREQIDNSAPSEKFMSDVYEHGFIDGAKDQLKRDIEKIYDFMYNFKLPNGVAPLYDYVGNVLKILEKND